MIVFHILCYTFTLGSFNFFSPKNPSIRSWKAGRYIPVQDLSLKKYTHAIGVDTKGKALYTLRVVINEAGEVVTAHPRK